jgi:phenylalanine ammonia-lyase
MELREKFARYSNLEAFGSLCESTINALRIAMESSTTMDAEPRMEHVAEALTIPILNHFIENKPVKFPNSSTSSPTVQSPPDAEASSLLGSISRFKDSFAERATALLYSQRSMFLNGSEDPNDLGPTPNFLAPGSRLIYTYIRRDLGVKMRGVDNHTWDQVDWDSGYELQEPLLGDDVTTIYECIRDHKMRSTLIRLFDIQSDPQV